MTPLTDPFRRTPPHPISQCPLHFSGRSGSLSDQKYNTASTVLAKTGTRDNASINTSSFYRRTALWWQLRNPCTMADENIAAHARLGRICSGGLRHYTANALRGLIPLQTGGFLGERSRRQKPRVSKSLSRNKEQQRRCSIVHVHPSIAAGCGRPR